MSKPQANLNTTVGLDPKMTLHTPPPTTETQYQEYPSCYWLNFDETLKIGSWEYLEQILTVMVTFVQATFVHIKGIFLGPSLSDANCHDIICPVNIWLVWEDPYNTELVSCRVDHFFFFFSGKLDLADPLLLVENSKKKFNPSQFSKLLMWLSKQLISPWVISCHFLLFWSIQVKVLSKPQPQLNST